MSVDELLLEIADNGWLINNLYQIDSALWRVNLRRPNGTGDYFTDWAEAPSLYEALTICCDKLSTAEWAEQYQPKVIRGVTIEPPKQTLLSRLGLTSRPKIERRL